MWLEEALEVFSETVEVDAWMERRVTDSCQPSWGTWMVRRAGLEARSTVVRLVEQDLVP